MPQYKQTQMLTVAEAADFLGVSKTAVIFAIKTKKLNAGRNNNNQWSIPLKTLEAYKELRESLLAKAGNTKGIDQKAVAKTILEKAIQNAAVNNIRITKNFEIHRGSSQKPLIDPAMFAVDPSILYLFFKAVQSDFTKRFSYEDIELTQQTFLDKLERLSAFLKETKKEKQKLNAVKAMIKTMHTVQARWLKLEGCTGKLLTDQGPLLFSTKVAEAAKQLIKDFCYHGDFTLNETLKIVAML